MRDTMAKACLNIN